MAKRTEYGKRRRAGFKAAGLCSQCGRRPAQTNRSLCAECLVYHATHKKACYAKLAAAGMCLCGRGPTRPGLKTCARCSERMENARLRRKYGASRPQKEALLLAQGNRCAICPATEPGGNAGWHLDHDHATGAIRGVLCARCNITLGKFEDNPDLLRTAANYIEKHRRVGVAA